MRVHYYESFYTRMNVGAVLCETAPWLSERAQAECECACQGPKDGELCLGRLTSGETLIEGRSDTDVQIVRLTWV